MIDIGYWTEEVLNQLAKKDDAAAEFIRYVVRSPYYDGYEAVRATIDNLNSELKNGVAKIVADELGDKNFERSHKYITEMQPYYEQLEYFRKRLLPQEQEETERAADLLDEARLAIKKNGKV